MFKSLRDTWKDAKAQAEAEQAAKAEKARRAQEAREPRVPRAGDMKALALEFVETCRSKGMVLDFTPATLPAFDRWIASSRRLIAQAEAERDPRGGELAGKVLTWTSAYLGELLCKGAAGTWADVGANTVVRVYGGGALFPLQVTVGLLRDGSAKEAGQSFDSASAYCAFAFDRLDEALMRAVCGSYSSPEELEAAMADDQDLARRLAGSLHMALTTANARWNVTLDFSLASVKAVESILDRMHVMAAKATPEQKASEDQIAGAAAVYGVYVGEVMRRTYNGKWSMAPNGALTLTVGEATLWPTQKVRKRLEDGEAESISYYVHVTGKMVRGELDLTGSRT